MSRLKQEGKSAPPSLAKRRQHYLLSLLTKANGVERTFVWEANTLRTKHALHLRWCVISSLIGKTEGWTPRFLGALKMLTSQGADMVPTKLLQTQQDILRTGGDQQAFAQGNE